MIILLFLISSVTAENEWLEIDANNSIKYEFDRECRAEFFMMIMTLDKRLDLTIYNNDDVYRQWTNRTFFLIKDNMDENKTAVINNKNPVPVSTRYELVINDINSNIKINKKPEKFNITIETLPPCHCDSTVAFYLVILLLLLITVVQKI